MNGVTLYGVSTLSAIEQGKRRQGESCGGLGEGLGAACSQ